ncbi:MAG: twin-arginine translocase TatA/TatE family subunit [Rhodospirillales bacterium]
MFDLGWSEFLLVGLVALVVIGPRELPAALRTLGQIVARVRFLVDEFRAGMHDFVSQAEDGMPSIDPNSFTPISAENSDKRQSASEEYASSAPHDKNLETIERDIKSSNVDTSRDDKGNSVPLSTDEKGLPT